jgi:hypothetical protein
MDVNPEAYMHCDCKLSKRIHKLCLLNLRKTTDDCPTCTKSLYGMKVLFHDFDEYLKALLLSQYDHSYTEKYPEYAKQVTELAWQVDRVYIRYFIDTGRTNAKQALEKVIGGLLHIERFVAPEVSIIKYLVDPFLEYRNHLFEATHQIIDIPDKVDGGLDTIGLTTRGMIMEIYWPHLDHYQISRLADWRSLGSADRSRASKREKYKHACYRYFKLVMGDKLN